MSKIVVNNLCLKYPIYGANTRSMKRSFLEFAIGGKLKEVNGSSIVTVDALSDVTFNLDKGDRLGLIGHNGSGKSTLLKVLSGIYQPTVGSVEVIGSVSSLLSVGVGMQPNSTGYENIRTRCLLHGYTKNETQRVIADIEEFAELGNFLGMPVKIYSSGMNLRLAFGIATAVTPDILLLDEVVGAGDAHFMAKAKTRLNNLVDKSNILVLATHSNDLIQKFCNKAIWLEQGKVKYFGETKEAIERYTQIQ